MAEAPLFSTVSAITELGVTAIVYTFVWQAYKHDRFKTGLIAFALTYEVLVNISYMTFRLFSAPVETTYSPGMTNLLIFHGTLSLIMFIGLVAFALSAIHAHKHGQNLIRESKGTTVAFCGLWAVSILTGELIYILNYLV